MIGQMFLTAILAAILLYAWSAYRKAPAIGLLSVAIALVALYFVWMPAQATWLAHAAGIGRGADLILYTWVLISLLILLNLHLKLRAQSELVTRLARAVALAEARRTPPAVSAPSGAPARSADTLAHAAMRSPAALARRGGRRSGPRQLSF
jgi:small membrane protein